MNGNLIVWIILLVLTLLSYFFGEEEIVEYSILGLIMIAFIKSCLIGFQFMELKLSHVFWKIGFVTVVGVFTLIITLTVL